jgi:CheY-like chemotaxis protein
VNTTPRSPDGGTPSLVGITVLVAEDDDVTRYAWLRYFDRIGATVTAVGDGQHALQVLQEGTIDVLVADLRLPGLDGFHLVAQARSLSRDLLAIAVTGFDDRGERDRALHAGFDAYLAKPIDPLTLAEEIAERLRAR